MKLPEEAFKNAIKTIDARIAMQDAKGDKIGADVLRIAKKDFEENHDIAAWQKQVAKINAGHHK